MASMASVIHAPGARVRPFIAIVGLGTSREAAARDVVSAYAHGLAGEGADSDHRNALEAGVAARLGSIDAVAGLLALSRAAIGRAILNMETKT